MSQRQMRRTSDFMQIPQRHCYTWLQIVRLDDAPVLPVHDNFIMHYTFGDMGELE